MLLFPRFGAALAPEHQYLIGSPSDEEQALVEQINRARANAEQEALRLANTDDRDIVSAINFFGVNLTEMINQFKTLDQTLPPLSPHPLLIDLARLHTQDMFDNVFQGHISSDNPPAPFSAGDTLADRVAKIGYNYTILGENVYAYARSVPYAHASFEIDWGFGDFGMQNPPEHRLVLHDPAYREIGIGVIRGRNSSETDTVGPVLVTQVLGGPSVDNPFITGVAYYDLNGNDFYDIGEGLWGLTVQTAEETAWALTAESGGYSIPVSGDGAYTVTFSGLGIDSRTTEVTITGGQNRKLDLLLDYDPPDVIGTTHPLTGQANDYRISTVPGATGYWLRVLSEDTNPWTEGAETGTLQVGIAQTGEYSVIQSERVASGLYAFHLAHPVGPSEEIIQLNRTVIPAENSQLLFASRLQWASPEQVAHVDVSADDGLNWESIFTQEGTGDAGEAAFISRSIPLSPYADRAIRIRFRYAFAGSSHFNGTTTNIGWLIDDISVTHSSLGTTESQAILASPDYTFTPPADGDYLLMARPLNNSRGFPFGRVLRVNAGVLTSLEIWQQAHFDPADLADAGKEATVWGREADPDRDGLDNLMEFSLGGNPLLTDSASVSPVLSRSGNVLVFRYTKHRNEVGYTVLAQTALAEGNWSSDGVTQSPDPAISPEGTLIEATAPLDESRRFLRLEAVLP